MEDDEFLNKCLEYIPARFKGDHPKRVLILNYLARMEDVHAAFPKMAANAADPYRMAELIPCSSHS